LRFVRAGIILALAVAPGLRADVLEMQNGDRYSGKVLSMFADTVMLNSEILGKISVPRIKVAVLTFGTNAPSQPAVSVARLSATNLPALAAPPRPAPAPIVVINTNQDLSARFRQLGADTNFIGQIRQQMFAGNPEAADKYDELVNGLLTGHLSVNDLRRQAQTSAQQLRELKRELGPDADDALDSYLKILEAFVNETEATPGNQPGTP
jgi:hypothetical protein